jgi:hypothetical protein
VNGCCCSASKQKGKRGTANLVCLSIQQLVVFNAVRWGGGEDKDALRVNWRNYTLYMRKNGGGVRTDRPDGPTSQEYPLPRDQLQPANAALAATVHLELRRMLLG